MLNNGQEKTNSMIHSNVNIMLKKMFKKKIGRNPQSFTLNINKMIMTKILILILILIQITIIEYNI
jgi:hypothetical protein